MRPNITSTALGGIANLALLAPIKPGFVAGFESITYVERLRKLLAALNASRIASRESAQRPAPFPDAVARFNIIQSFRYAIVDPRADSNEADPAGSIDQLLNPGVYQLSLNVTFDGGWEPYMRVIYRDIGTLLDALFCHCEDYPLTRDNDFDTYCRWVRAHEIGGGLFYTESSMTASDQRYLKGVERIQRETRDPALADRMIAAFALESSKDQSSRALREFGRDPRWAIASSLRSIKGFYRLSVFFPNNAARDDTLLIRFAQDVLSDFHGLQPALAASTAFQTAAAPFAEELAWFRTSVAKQGNTAAESFNAGSVQAGILQSFEGITHGCIVLLRVDEGRAAAARDFLAGFPVTRDGAVLADDAVRRTLALSCAGLRALGMSQADLLEVFPQEFIDGMEARAGLLGDVRGNHPDNWVRPLRNWPAERAAAGERVDLTTVHVVLVLRCIDAARPEADLHPRLEADIAAQGFGSHGLTVVSVQPTRSQREGQNTREHFGFLDGFSQPTTPFSADRASHPVSDQLKLGELLLGYLGDKGEEPATQVPVDPLLQGGTFLVVRKLRQRTDVLNEVLNPQVAQPTAVPLLEQMMGRGMDGVSPAAPQGAGTSNDFDYAGDPQGAKCPFQSHVRRTNPRDGRPFMPRIFRRGMSYGPRVTGAADLAAERGSVFMACCASLAEQFEVVQRWVTGGNSSGLSSSLADPLFGVPEAGDKRTWRYARSDGSVGRLDLGERRFVELEWGLYTFVPSADVLARLPSLLGEREGPAEKAMAAPTPDFERWQRALEDPSGVLNVAAWKHVREASGGDLQTAYGRLIGSAAKVLEVLKDEGQAHSVCGYGRRMGESIGLGFLGLDPHDGHDAQAEYPAAVNAAITKITAEEAFTATRLKVAAALTKLTPLANVGTDGIARLPVDLLSLSEAVLARLCTLWFGLPDDESATVEHPALMTAGGRRSDATATGVPRCPGHLLSTSRFIFAPQPSDTVKAEGRVQGAAVLGAVRQMLARGAPTAPLALDIAREVQKLLDTQAEAVRDTDLIARTIAGVMLGFPPTVHGNFVRVIASWIKSSKLWALQQRLAENTDYPVGSFERAEAVLRQEILNTMREAPLPEMIWRTPAEDKASAATVEPTDKSRTVVLGLASAMSDADADDSLMFGGSRDPAHAAHAIHACPGYEMAVGVLLGLLSGLLEAGELRPTGSAISLTLVPRPSPPANPPAPAAATLQ